MFAEHLIWLHVHDFSCCFNHTCLTAHCHNYESQRLNYVPFSRSLAAVLIAALHCPHMVVTYTTTLAGSTNNVSSELLNPVFTGISHNIETHNVLQKKLSGETDSTTDVTQYRDDPEYVQWYVQNGLAHEAHTGEVSHQISAASSACIIRSHDFLFISTAQIHCNWHISSHWEDDMFIAVACYACIILSFYAVFVFSLSRNIKWHEALTGEVTW